MNSREWAQSERHALCDLMDAVGPAAPTLCGGWTVAHMAAHLVVRERRPDTGPGLVLSGAPARHTARVTNRLAESGDFTQLVDRVRRGPPLLLRSADGAMNLVEFVVHHEDVRRAGDGWAPRSDIDGLEALLWARLDKGAKLMCRRLVDVDLTLARPTGETIHVGKVGRPATLTGGPVELVNFLFGRRDRVEAEVAGDEGAVHELQTGHLGI
ncbi:MAG: TIGR03085 family protein [Actinobacteria bacterium]|nr:TIGR03085 family protein [Actinomycetota bacterium]